MQDAYEEFQTYGAELIAISVDDIGDAKRMAEHAATEFPVLADPTAKVARQYGVYDRLGDGLAAPATLIIDKEKQVVGSHVGINIADRVATAMIIRALADMRGQET